MSNAVEPEIGTPFYPGITTFPSPPKDPQLWSRVQVAQWLQQAVVQYQLESVQAELFPMNGKGLVLLSKDMFLYRVPVGGGMLYEDIQLRLQKISSKTIKLAATIHEH